MSGANRISNPTRGSLSRIDTGKLQIGIVKETGDSEATGRLKVWIKGSNTLESDPTGWITCGYASPFAGATDPAVLGGALQSFTDTQTSYGIWAVPPDTGNEVIVCFINGDIRKAYWIACLYQKDMNYMIPGIPEGASFQSAAAGGNALPVAEYNKLGNTADQRPAYSPLAEGLAAQGLLGDELRGAGSSGARRESPSAVFGWLTPGGNQLILDDGQGSELIRLRTKSGAQLLISETSGHIYAISRDGNSWFELNNDGNVDIYAGAGFSVNAIGDINFKTAGNLNIDAANVNIKTSQDTSINVGGNINQTSVGDTNVQVGKRYATAYMGDIKTFTPAGTFKNYYDTLPTTYTNIVENSPAPQKHAPSLQESLRNSAGQETPVQTITTRTPDHEPWAPHAAAVVGTREKVELGTSRASQGSISERPAAPLTVVGSPTPGLEPGVYLPKGYDKNEKPVYEYSGTTTALTDTNQLVTSDEGLQFIARQEGFSSRKYRDAAGFSIGYGHYIIPSDPPSIQNGPISQEVGLQLLRQDVKKAENAVRKYITVKLTQSQFDALVDFTFNCGGGALQGSTLRRKLNAGDYSSVPTELSKWNKSQGKVLPVLIKRRREEALLFARPAQTA